MEEKEWFTTKEVADLFCVSIDTVRAWRSPAYADSPLRLIGRRFSHNDYRYHIDVLEAFVLKHPRFHPHYALALRRGVPVIPVHPRSTRRSAA